MTIELVKEELEEMAGGVSGVVGGRLTGYIFIYLQEHDFGQVFNADTDFMLPDVGKRRPDVAFASYATVPEIPRDFVAVPPDLAVEVVSRTDQIDDSDAKILEYRQAKIKLIWVIRTVLKVVEVHHLGKPILVLEEGDELDGYEVLPGFKLPVHKLFAFPTQARPGAAKTMPPS